MANTRKIESAEMLGKHIRYFIAKCENDGLIPSDYELLKFLNVSVATLDRYRAGEGTYKGDEEPLKNLQAYREHRLLRQLEDKNANSAGAIFQLKQAKNGGYTDAPQGNDSGATVTLRIEGVGGVEAFK